MSSLRARLEAIASSIQRRLALLGLAWSRLTGDEYGIVDALLELGKLSGLAAQLDQAWQFYADARDRAAQLGYDFGLQRAALGLGLVSLRRGDAAAAIKVLEPEVARFRGATDPYHAAEAFMNLGVANEKLDRLDLAAAAYGEAERLCSKHGDWSYQAWALRNLGGIAFKQEHFVDARGYWKQALTLYERHGKRLRVAEVQYWLGLAAGHLGLNEEAHDFIAASVDSYQRAGKPELANRSSALLEANRSDEEPENG